MSRGCNSLFHPFKNECLGNPFRRWFVSIAFYTTFTLPPYYFPLSYMVNETEWEKRWPTWRGGALSIARSHCSHADLPQLSCNTRLDEYFTRLEGTLANIRPPFSRPSLSLLRNLPNLVLFNIVLNHVRNCDCPVTQRNELKTPFHLRGKHLRK